MECNENQLYNYISEGKKMLDNFIQRFKIKKILKNEQKYFDDILFNHQSFNEKSLSNLFEYLDYFDQIYKIYNLYFFSIYSNIESINNIITNNYKMKNGYNISRYVNNICNEFEIKVEKISSLHKLESKVEEITKEMLELKKENKKNIIEIEKNYKKDIIDLKNEQSQKIKDMELNQTQKLTALRNEHAKTIKDIEITQTQNRG